MSICPETRKLIDEMCYEAMLEKWRNAPVGHPMFQGEVGDYFTEVMKRKRAQVGDAEHTAASKRIGWEGGR